MKLPSHKKSAYLLPSSFRWLLFVIAYQLTPLSKYGSIMLAIYVLYAINAVVHDYRIDAKFTKVSLLYTVLDLIAIVISIMIMLERLSTDAKSF